MVSRVVLMKARADLSIAHRRSLAAGRWPLAAGRVRPQFTIDFAGLTASGSRPYTPITSISIGDDQG